MCYFQEKVEILNFCYRITGSHRNVCENFSFLMDIGGTIDIVLLGRILPHLIEQL